jgi:hypothetical protein
MFRQHTLHPRPRVFPSLRARQRSRMGMEREGMTQTRSANGRGMDEGRKKGGRTRAGGAVKTYSFILVCAVAGSALRPCWTFGLPCST